MFDVDVGFLIFDVLGAGIRKSEFCSSPSDGYLSGFLRPHVLGQNSVVLSQGTSERYGNCRVTFIVTGTKCAELRNF